MTLIPSSNWPAALLLGALCGCGSSAPKPTLPAPEFEVPELTPWDAGTTDESESPSILQGSAKPAAPSGNAPDPAPESAALPAEAAPVAAEPSASSLPVAEPPTRAMIEPKP